LAQSKSAASLYLPWWQSRKKFLDSGDGADNERRFLEFIISPERPDAILAEADFRICRRIGTIRKAGLRVPDELMLVGCYNTPLSTHPDCPFSSISLREDEMARLAADIISSGQSRHLIKTVIPELIVR
jgi:DNA-binding LacI/PurR family transcriptional regulator